MNDLLNPLLPTQNYLRDRREKFSTENLGGSLAKKKSLEWTETEAKTPGCTPTLSELDYTKIPHLRGQTHTSTYFVFSYLLRYRLPSDLDTITRPEAMNKTRMGGVGIGAERERITDLDGLSVSGSPILEASMGGKDHG